MVHPAVLALVVIVLLAAYGVWIIKSATSGIPETEGFGMNAGVLKCEAERSACLKQGTKSIICDEEAVTCLSKISRNVSTATQAASTGDATPSEINCRKNLEECKKTRTDDVCLAELKVCMEQVESVTDKRNLSEYYELRRVVDAGLDYSQAELSPDFRGLLERVRDNIPLQYSRPTAAQSENEDIPANATYTPSQQIIRPHQTPAAQQPTLTAITPSDTRTEAELLTPSLRQQIRDDVKGAVNSVLTDINNQYEIKYVYQ